MRRFKFRLEAVMKHRAVVEEQKLQAFATVPREMAESDVRIAVLRAEYESTVASRPEHIDVADIARRERYIDTLNVQIAEEERVREGISARLDDARAALIVARQAREAIERIREKDYFAHLQSAVREEQIAIDEIATLRHARTWTAEA